MDTAGSQVHRHRALVYNDPVSFRVDFRDKPSVIQIAPGHARSFSMTVAIKDYDNE